MNCIDNVYVSENMVGAQAAILMFDLTSRSSFQKLKNLYKNLSRVCNKYIPIVLVGNKCDENSVVTMEEIREFTSKYNLYYCDISVKMCHNIQKPFSYLMQKFSCWSDLKIKNFDY